MKRLFIQNLITYFPKLLNISITASYIIIVVMAIHLIFRKLPKWSNCALWGIVAIRLICPFSMESALSLIPSKNTIPVESLSFQGQKLLDPLVIDVVNNPTYQKTVWISLDTTVSESIDIFTVLSYIWLLGIVLLISYVIFNEIRLRRIVSDSIILEEGVKLTDKIGTPFLLGIIKKTIFIPFSINEVDREYVIAHEKAHIRRGDYLWKPLGFLLLTVYWFNPLIWIAYILLSRDIEAACDEKVIKDMREDERSAYSNALLNCSIKSKYIPVYPLAFGEKGVKTRINDVMNYKKPRFLIIIVAIIICIAVAACLLTDPVSYTEKTIEDESTIYKSSEEIENGISKNDDFEDNAINNTGKMQSFKDILGYSGVIESIEMDHFSTRIYCAFGEDGEVIPLAESYGFELDDTLVDLDDDGMKELLCNCVSGGDGHPELIVYKLNKITGEVEQGFYNHTEDLDEWFNWGINSMTTMYDKDENALVVTYDKGDENESETAKVKYYGKEIIDVISFDSFSPSIDITGNNLG